MGGVRESPRRESGGVRRRPAEAVFSPMAGRKPKPPVAAKDLQGFKYFEMVGPLLAGLHADGTEADKAGNRQLFFDQYVALLLLYFFNPILTSLRGLQQASELDKVQKALGCPRASLGS